MHENGPNGSSGTTSSHPWDTEITSRWLAFRNVHPPARGLRTRQLCLNESMTCLDWAENMGQDLTQRMCQAVRDIEVNQHD